MLRASIPRRPKEEFIMNSTTTTAVKDPVCGMDIETSAAAG